MNHELNHLWEQMSSIERATRESFIEFNRLAARSIDRIAQQELAFVEDWAAIAVQGWRASMGSRAVQDVLNEETRLAAEYGKKWMANAHRMLEISLEAQNDLGQWMTRTLQRWDGWRPIEQGQQAVRAIQPARPCPSSLRWEKTFIVDDPMLALITRFVCGCGQFHLSEGEFILDQIATIQRYVAQFPVEQRNTRAIEWIEKHAERYRQAWQKKAVYAQALQTRCADCPLAEESCMAHCEIHHRWLDLLHSYVVGEVSSRRYVEDTLRLLTDYKARLKVTALRDMRGAGQPIAASLSSPVI
jgi:hypothetical protein